MITKHSSNPVLTGTDIPYNEGYQGSCVFNAGVTKVDGEYLMLFRNDFGYQEGARFTGTNLGLARSRDGINWVADPKPALSTEGIREQWGGKFGAITNQEIYRVYDPRISVVDGEFLLCFAMDTKYGVCGAIARTKDFENYELLSSSSPDNRNMVLFPEKIGGKYIRLERPFPMYGRQPERFDIWSAQSPDLRYWGDNRLVISHDKVPYGNSKIGPAAPPVRTERGWLTTIHAVQKVEEELSSWHKNWHKVYHAGLILLDLDDPSKVIGMARTPLIESDQPYELEGFRGSVIFPCGMILEDSGEVKIYYGSADTVIALATASLDDLLASIEPME